MPEITKLDEHSQGTTRDKYKVMARAKKMSHDDLYEKVQSHMLTCTDCDCDICDMGQDGSMIDDDSEGKGSNYNYGTRSSKDRIGSSTGKYDVDEAGCAAERETKGDKTNLLKHGQHTSKHPGFKAVARKIASSQGLSAKAAGAILAARTRSASAVAKKANPRLKRVK